MNNDQPKSAKPGGLNSNIGLVFTFFIATVCLPNSLVLGHDLPIPHSHPHGLDGNYPVLWLVVTVLVSFLIVAWIGRRWVTGRRQILP